MLCFTCIQLLSYTLNLVSKSKYVLIIIKYLDRFRWSSFFQHWVLCSLIPVNHLKNLCYLYNITNKSIWLERTLPCRGLRNLYLSFRFTNN